MYNNCAAWNCQVSVKWHLNWLLQRTRNVRSCFKGFSWWFWQENIMCVLRVHWLVNIYFYFQELLEKFRFPQFAVLNRIKRKRIKLNEFLIKQLFRLNASILKCIILIPYSVLLKLIGTKCKRKITLLLKLCFIITI